MTRTATDTSVRVVPRLGSPVVRAQPPDVAPAHEVLRRVRALPPSTRTVVVGLDGRSGSGKTRLADELAATLGWPVVRLDEIYPGWDGLATAPDVLATHVLLPLRDGRDASWPTWDWVAGAPGPTAHLPWTPHVLVEGCGTGAPPAGPLVDLLVWLEAPEGLRRERALSRDGQTFAPHWERWAAQEAEVLCGVAERADLVLDTSGLG